MKVLMTPHLDDFDSHESGIRRVIEAYFNYLPDYGIKLVNKSDKFDLHAVHVGAVKLQTDIAHLHGLYWSADYNASWEFGANKGVIESARQALEITVPSPWVAETIKRDMRFSPHVIPHGIEWTEWEPQEHQGYVLWNKNRNADVCDPTPAFELARIQKTVELVTTFLPFGVTERLPNVRGVGLMKHSVMKRHIQRAMVYLSTTKETFGIGVLEAMASGVPVLGFDWGGNQDLVKHGVNGYLARPNDIHDLAEGLDYCIKYRNTLSDNAREMAKLWSWPNAVEKVANVYNLAMQSDPEDNRVAVVIPCFNLAHMLERAVTSAIEQTLPPDEIIIIDDGSTDNTSTVGNELASRHSIVRYIRQENAGVAHARNAGVQASDSEFICCLDADDFIKPRFLEACVATLKTDRTLGIAYTGLEMLNTDGRTGMSQWPSANPEYDRQLSARGPEDLKGVNQIPTCNVFRKEAWRRTGGYKQRYAPLGAGAEDAEFWARIFSVGYGARKASDLGLFLYSLGGKVSKPFSDGTGDKNLLEPPWLGLHPWAIDKYHPFASMATPSNKLSHPVRQYDQPDVSIIIPVGPGHEDIMWDALDSLESQTVRRWEAIVVVDGTAVDMRFHQAYPYVRFAGSADFRGGAGYARNRGREIARAPFLVFLDADDTLAPSFLEECILNWKVNKTIGYTDYIQKTIIPEESLDNFLPENIISYLPKKQEALIRGYSAEYDCERAQRQPSHSHDDFFHWCLVTTFVPAIWHDAIGGFDESMESFEDVLYHWSIARHGYCYTRIPQPLVSYRTYTGHRRERASLYTEEGRRRARTMLEYAESVLKGINMAKCSKCPSGQTKVNVFQEMDNISTQLEQEAAQMQDNTMKMCRYAGNPIGNVGNHHVIGAITKRRYGYRGGGTEFLVHVDDIAAQPHLFAVIPSDVAPPPAEVTQVAPPVSLNPNIDPNLQPAPLQPSSGEIPAHVAPQVMENNQGVVANPVIKPATAPVAPIVETVETVVESVVETPPVAPIQPVPRAQSDISVGGTVGGGTVIGGEAAEGNNLVESNEPLQTFMPEVASVDEEIDMQSFPGINNAVASELKKLGISTKRQLATLGKEGLLQINGIGEIRALAILEALARE